MIGIGLIVAAVVMRQYGIMHNRRLTSFGKPADDLAVRPPNFSERIMRAGGTAFLVFAGVALIINGVGRI